MLTAYALGADELVAIEDDFQMSVRSSVCSKGEVARVETGICEDVASAVRDLASVTDGAVYSKFGSDDVAWVWRWCTCNYEGMSTIGYYATVTCGGCIERCMCVVLMSACPVDTMDVESDVHAVSGEL